MSLSFPDRTAVRASGVLLMLGVASAASGAFAAQVYTQPRVTLTAESNTNRELDIVSEKSSEGYVAELQWLIGVATPRSETTLRPWVRLQQYPDSESSSDIEGILELASSYRSERGNLSFYGSYDRRDTAHSEFGGPDFENLNPDDPTSPQTGRASAGEVREFVNLRPSYGYQFTQRMGGGLALQLQRSTYSGPATLGYVDYDYYSAEPYLRFKTTPRSSLDFGPSFSRYETRGSSVTSDAVGALLGYSTEWSPIWQTELTVRFQRNSLDGASGGPAADTDSSGAGATFSATHRSQVTSTSIYIGRLITPNGNGTVVTSDQIQLSAQRDLSARLRLQLAGRYNRDKGIYQSFADDTWQYATAYSRLEWRVRPNWFIAGAVEYVWQRYDFLPNGADNFRASIGFGYQGLDRPR